MIVDQFDHGADLREIATVGDVFRCPEAVNQEGIMHLSVHPRLMANSYSRGNAMFTPPPRISRIRESSRKTVIWDGVLIEPFQLPTLVAGQVVNTRWNAHPLPVFMGNDAYFSPFNGLLRGAAGDSDDAIFHAGQTVHSLRTTWNRDLPGTDVSVQSQNRHGFRYRHNGDEASNLVYLDGSARTKRIGQVTWGDVLISGIQPPRGIAPNVWRPWREE